MRSVVLATLLFAAALGPTARTLAAPARDAPVATDPAVADPTARQIAGWISADDAKPQPLPTDLSDDGAPPLERRIHGEVGATVSNRGYGGYAAVAMPVGRASEVDLAVAGEHLDRHGPWGGGDRRAIALNVRLDGGDIAGLVRHERCNVPRWGVVLKNDPVVTADGACLKRAEPAAGDRKRGRRSGRAGPGSEEANLDATQRAPMTDATLRP